jgi:aerobic-type carbon monoxide dehydrogenase small subunit (CoxS/CutS family)
MHARNLQRMMFMWQSSYLDDLPKPPGPQVPRYLITDRRLLTFRSHLNNLYSQDNHMELLINNKQYSYPGDADESLLYVLRNHFDLTGSKYGCGEGACGACTVLVNGVATRSCITKVRSLEGKSITTIEGLEKDGELHPVQKAFLKVDAFQCAYCAPGMVMSAVSLLEKNPKPSEQEIIRSMQGNICRCGTYPKILEAIQEAANV